MVRTASEGGALALVAEPDLASGQGAFGETRSWSGRRWKAQICRPSFSCRALRVLLEPPLTTLPFLASSSDFSETQGSALPTK